ncbi:MULTISPECIES: DUF779 domain-containing protein [Psychrobacter]|nr:MULTISPECIES: DUF779 domain-containing protein [Psychrobacter]
MWTEAQYAREVTNGRGASFSLEIPEGKRFIVRSEVCTVVD